MAEKERRLFSLSALQQKQKQKWGKKPEGRKEAALGGKRKRNELLSLQYKYCTVVGRRENSLIYLAGHSFSLSLLCLPQSYVR